MKKLLKKIFKKNENEELEKLEKEYQELKEDAISILFDFLDGACELDDIKKELYEVRTKMLDNWSKASELMWKEDIKMKYEALYEYLKNNELHDSAEDIAHDKKNDQAILMILDHFDDEMMIKDSSTALLKDMLEYYSNHK